MAVQRLFIHEFMEASRKGLLVDVRSPGEFQHGHIPGAVNLPLFTDEERKVVGTAYKQESRESAIRIGLDYFGPKMRTVVETLDRIFSDQSFTVLGQNPVSISGEASPDNEQLKTEKLRTVFLYCWRGGMRSGAMAWLLDLYGFRVFVLNGGYKTFRNLVLESFHRPYIFKVIGGYTGSGKTEILKELAREGKKVIDLEALASHKGSAFGKHGMPPQPSQEMFENLLSSALLSHTTENLSLDHPIWLEDESQRIGDLNIPQPIWKNIRESPIYFFDIPFEERLQHILEEYGSCPQEKLKENIDRIAKRLGPQHAKAAIQFLDEGNIKEAFRILLQYYDKRYLKGLHNREQLADLLSTLPCDQITVQNAKILTKQTRNEKPFIDPVPGLLI